MRLKDLVKVRICARTRCIRVRIVRDRVPGIISSRSVIIHTSSSNTRRGGIIQHAPAMLIATMWIRRSTNVTAALTGVNIYLGWLLSLRIFRHGDGGCYCALNVLTSLGTDVIRIACGDVYHLVPLDAHGIDV